MKPLQLSRRKPPPSKHPVFSFPRWLALVMLILLALAVSRVLARKPLVSWIRGPRPKASTSPSGPIFDSVRSLPRNRGSSPLGSSVSTPTSDVDEARRYSPSFGFDIVVGGEVKSQYANNDCRCSMVGYSACLPAFVQYLARIVHIYQHGANAS